jgi:uncharacterized protein YoxC
MVEKVVNSLRVELTPWMKFVLWVVVALFAAAQLVFQVRDNAKDIKKVDENLVSHQQTDDLRHTQVIERIHGTELMYTEHKTMLNNINIKTNSIDERFERLEDYLIQFDYEKNKKE